MKTIIHYSMLLFSLCIFNIERAFCQSQDFQWAVSFPGGVDQEVHSIAIDSAGNIYSCGIFNDSVDFDPGPGISMLSSTGLRDVFISKFDKDGNFVWAKSLRGTLNNSEDALGMAMDPIANIYITGTFNDTVDFNPGPGTFNVISKGIPDSYILKLDSAGNFIWVRTFAGVYSNYSNSIDVDAGGNSYTTGSYYDSTDFDPGLTVFYGPWVPSPQFLPDIFICKLDSAGKFVWLRSIGSSKGEEGKSIILNKSGNCDIFVTGSYTTTMDFDPGTGVTNLVPVSASGDIYVTRFDCSGNFIWAKSMGGSAVDQPYSIALDDYENVYSTGSIQNQADMDPGPSIFMLDGGGGSTYISKLDSGGNFAWAGSFDGFSGNEGLSITTNYDNDVYISGWFSGIQDFDPGPDSLFLDASPFNNVYIVKLDSACNFISAQSIKANYSRDMAIDSDNNMVIGGYFDADTVLFGSTTIINYDPGTLDGYLAKVGYCSANFNLYADTAPQNWIIVNQVSGIQPITYTWSWGDGTTSAGATPSHIYSTPYFYNICVTFTDATGCTATFCDSSVGPTMASVNVILPTGISHPVADPRDMNIYPNPANGNFTITLPENTPLSDITITSVTGAKMYETTVTGKRMIQVDAKDFSAGIYFVQVRSQGKLQTKKLVVAWRP